MRPAEAKGHRIAYTSIAAYRESVLDGTVTAQHGEIMRLMYRAREYGVVLNRRIIAVRSGFPINAVTGRVRTLIDSGLLEVESERVDPITKKKVEYLRAVMPKPEQASFEDWRKL